jgi:hypothetical protein
MEAGQKNSLNNSTINAKGDVRIGDNIINIYQFTDYKELNDKVTDLKDQLKDK